MLIRVGHVTYPHLTNYTEQLVYEVGDVYSIYNICSYETIQFLYSMYLGLQLYLSIFGINPYQNPLLVRPHIPRWKDAERFVEVGINNHQLWLNP